MIALRRILLPTDFSPWSGHATRYACAFAEQFNAELHILHVLEEHVSVVPEFGMGLVVPERLEESRMLAEQALDRVLEPGWANGRQVVKVLRQGTPFVETVQYAREQEIDLIVLTTHGRTGLAHALMGSVAERIVRKSPCPVLTIRPTEHQFVMP